jgi:hypothetical protein
MSQFCYILLDKYYFPMKCRSRNSIFNRNETININLLQIDEFPVVVVAVWRNML